MPCGSSLYEATHNNLGNSLWAPFWSQCDWEFAHWAKMCGPTSTAVTELLAMPEVINKLGLSYSTSSELNKIIDTLHGPPPFEAHELVIEGETLLFHCCDIILCVKALFGNPAFVDQLAFAPERRYTDSGRTCRVYNELHTGDWWWSVQSSLETLSPGATIIPILLSSDKTQLTLFCGKVAYPIYLRIGNIPKDVHRKPSRSAQLLVGYIPTSKLEGIANKAARCRSLANLFHSCMGHVLGSIRAYREQGIVLMEQALVTCMYQGRCPKCFCFPTRDLMQASNTFQLADEDSHAFHAACRKAGFKPVYHPFWQGLPFTNIFDSITPDILHQLLQGVMKHLLLWLTNSAVFGAAEIDAWCQAMPPSHHITFFPKGIMTLSRVSGKEHKAMCHILLSLITDIPLPGGQVASRVVRSTRAFLNFTFLAQFPSHTTYTLCSLEDSLAEFHDNKDIFIDVGVRDNFNLPKLHSLLHYGPSIALFGTTDNYNSEQMVRLHIELPKKGYRASNGKDKEFQMTTHAECREKMMNHMAYIKCAHTYTPNERVHCPRFLKMAKNPTLKAVTFNKLSAEYGAVDFQDCLADFIAKLNYPGASAAVLRHQAVDTLLPFQMVLVFHRIKFMTSHDSDNTDFCDGMIIRPKHIDTHRCKVPSRFDTVVVWGHRIAQVRVVFQIPNKVILNVFPSSDTTIPSHLTYVEWFSPLSSTPDENSLLYRVSRLIHRGCWCSAIIPVERIMCSIHLLPHFGPAAPRDWKSFSVLDKCNTFYVNPFSDRHNYLLFSRH
ncbi:hypothetical protein EI94DRAFT_1878699 [Lactarius quietus]|nr:hypothetical protein EI94DRAFT_1878699 [Lactarius quietus]